ncbi:MAG: hypothetical protein LBH12_04225, partial [Dysgonamonadaceae bacterium]|nr:hypothetical protein [Dysgonamonadaceae bacterium]
MHHLRLIFFIPIIFFFTYSCDDGFEDYSTNSDHRLTFSTDTISFDTIISTISTSYRAFKVYNKNSDHLLISTIYLEKGEQSEFKMNVDGQAAVSLNNVEIRSNDSIFVLINAKPAETGMNTPQNMTDYIVFVTNGVQQKVLLEASAQDAFLWTGIILDSDSVLSNEKPYVIYDSLVIEKSAHVQIPEGAIFYMHNHSEIIVKGTLTAKGSLEKPILFRGDRLDNLIPDIPYDRVPGQWKGFRFDSDSYNNKLEYVYIRNGIHGLNCELSDPELLKLKLKNVVITNFKGILIHSVNCNIVAENCEFSNSQSALLNMIGGNYSFTHCTFANYYPGNAAGWGRTDNMTLVFQNEYFEGEEKQYFPITKADFYNSIVWGSKEKSSSRILIKKSDESDIAYYFENCLIPIDEKADWSSDWINQCILNKNPEFKTLLIGESGKSEFIYDFGLTEKSPAVNAANRFISETIPLDLKG